MRISDWSSDVCSSDLLLEARAEVADQPGQFRLEHEAEVEQQQCGAAAFQIGAQRRALGRQEHGARAGDDRQRAGLRYAGVGGGDQLAGLVALRLQGAAQPADAVALGLDRSEEHTSELQSLMRISYAVL